MSYLDKPRINFSGSFQASPSTINNTPNNYDPARYNEDSLKPDKIELFWEPKGDSIFDLKNCTVTTVETSSGGNDPLVGAGVTALYTGAPPKLVDLDPMQQNVSEIWGLTVMIGDFGGAYVQGVFTPVAYNSGWINSQGPDSPQSSVSASAVYQSTLTQLKWNVGNSAVLQALQKASPNRLSIRMVVSAHNNAPQFFAFTTDTFQTMRGRGVPQAVLDKLESLKHYVMNVDGSTPPKPRGPGWGFIPTQMYVSSLLEQLLGQSTAQQYSQTILEVAKQPYQPWSGTKEQPLYDYNFGKLVGSVGPCLDDEPTFAVPARLLAPPPPPTTPPPPNQPPPVSAFCAQAQLDLQGPTPSLTVDLANSLPVQLPGRPLWAEQLGTLSLAYYTVSGDKKVYTPIGPSIDYAHPDFIDKQSGMLVVNLSADDAKTLASHPLALRSTIGTGTSAVTRTLLEENSEGVSMRADQFVFRMNPGMTTTPTFPLGGTHTVNIYVRKFGRVEGTEKWKIALTIMKPEAASAYTNNTLGTGGTNGIGPGNISRPVGALSLWSPDDKQLPADVVSISGGKATLKIKGANPGNPRGYVDGQIYFTQYALTPAVAGYYQNPDELISVQIYQQDPIFGTPSWVNGIGDILRQYGMLYPIMGRFQLWTYEGVVENRDKIQRVLGMDIGQPLHMPVSRDLSTIKSNLILNWFKTGMPYNLGPVGGMGTPWDNLPTVNGWGPMTRLVVRSGDIIDAIQPIYGSRAAPFQGGPGGTAATIDLTGDAIVSITGFTGAYFGMMQVAQLTFKTVSGKTYGPFGTMHHVQNPQPFELKVPTGSTIQSFCGKTVVHTNGSTYIAALGGNLQLH